MINFLTGIDVKGNIDLNSNELKEVRIDNESSAPTGSLGRIYYDTGTNKLRLYNGSWVDLDTGTDGDTTYELNGIGSTNASIGIRLAGSDTSTDDVLFTGAGTTVMTRSGNTLTITSNDQFDGTVTSVSQTHGGNAFTVGGSPITSAGTLAITMAGASTQYINGLGNLITFPTIPTVGNGTLTVQGSGALGGSGTFTANQSGATTISVTHDSFTDTATATTGTLSFGGTFDAYTDVTTNATGHVTGHEVTTFTLPSNPNVNTTYTLPVSAGGANTAIVTLDANSGTDSTLTFSGTANEIAITETIGNDGTITIGLPDDVTIAGELTVSGTGDSTFTGQVAVPTANAAGNAPNLGQVQSLIAGVGIFQGGYNATTGSTTDLGAGNGSLDGASNIALDKGDYFAVTVGGTAFYSEILEPGDMIYANQDITASSSPAITVYTVVIQDENIAGSGTTDGATTKGVAGFDSSTFTVTGNGWVQSTLFTGSQGGIVQNTSGNVATVYLNGQGAFSTPPNDNTQYTAGTGLTLSTLTFNANVDGTQSVSANTSSSTASRTYKVQVDSGDNLVVNVPWSNTTYNMMSATTLGLGKLESDAIQYTVANSISTTTSRTYGIQKNASNQLVVNVPWVNDDTGITAITLNTGAGQTVPLTGSISGTTLTLTSNTYQGGSNIGYVPPGGVVAKFLTGAGTWVTPTNTTYSQATTSTLGLVRLSTAAEVLTGTDAFETITPALLASTTYTSTYPSSLTNTWTIASGTHNLGTGPFVIQTYDASTGAQVFIKTTADPSTGVVTMATTSNQSVNAIRVVMMKVW